MCNDAYIDDMMDIPYGEGEGVAYGELMNNSHYGQEHPDQQEANFYFAIQEFQDIVKQYGVKKVIAELPQDVYDLLYWYFYDKAMADPFEVSEDWNREELQFTKAPWLTDDEIPF